jgi:hypothetical protein
MSLQKKNYALPRKCQDLFGFNRPTVNPPEKARVKSLAPSNNIKIKQISCLKFRNSNQLKLRMILKSIFQEIVSLW